MEIKTWKELNKKGKRKRIKKHPTLEPSVESSVGQSAENDLASNFKSKKISKAEDWDSELADFYKSDKDDKIISDRNNFMPVSRKGKSHKSYSKNKADSSARKASGGLAKKIWWLTAFLIVAALITTWGAWRWAGPQGNAQELELTISSPEQIAVGEESVFIIHYKNVGRVDLLRMELTLKYPSGLKVRSTEPEAIDSLNKSWQIGELKVGESGEIKITAQIFGDEGEKKKMVAEMVYQPANFSSDFVVTAESQMVLGSSQFSLVYSGPESTLPETENDWQVKIKNISDNEIKDVELRLITSHNFKMRESEPEIDSIDDSGTDEKIYIWPKRLWQQQQEIGFTWNGKFDPEARGVEVMKIEIIAFPDGVSKVLQEKSFDIPILGEELALSLSVNDSEQLSDIAPGGELNYKVAIHNTSGKDLKDLKVSLRLTPDYIDWTDLTAPAEPDFDSGGIITLTSEKYDKLKLISAGDKLEFDIKVKVKDNVTDANAQIKASTSAQVGMVGDQTKEDLSFSTRTIITEVKVPIKFYSSAQYYDDEGIPVGSGPLPPQVGEETTYQISFSIGKTDKSFEKITVNANLPDNVVWGASQQVEQGVFGFSPSNRRVTWELSNISSLDHEISAKFKVKIIPQQSDIGKVIYLVLSPTISAKVDGGDTFSISKLNLDTNLTGALYGSGQGEVISQ